MGTREREFPATTTGPQSEPRPQTRPSTTIRSTRAPASAGITTTQSASPASMPMPALPRGFIIRDTVRGEPRQPGPAQLHRGCRRQRDPARSSRTRSSSAPNINALGPDVAGYGWSSATTPGSLWYAHVYERNRWRAGLERWRGRRQQPYAARPVGDPRVLRRHDAGQRDRLPARSRSSEALPAAPAQRLQRAVPEPAAVRRRRQSERHHAERARAIPTNCDRELRSEHAGHCRNVLQIGTEGGFLPYPALIPTNVPFNPVNRSTARCRGAGRAARHHRRFQRHAGKSIILYNDAPAPFPMGDPANDYFPGWNVKDNPATRPPRPDMARTRAC